MNQKLCAGCKEPDIDKLPGCPLQCKSDKCKAYQTKTHFNPHTKPIVWVLGGPACGKMTQCSRIINKYGFTHLSTGDIIRAEVQTGSIRAKCLTSIMNRGGLIPNELMLEVLREAMEVAARKGCRGYLIDGYPREKSQGLAFERAVGKVALILYFEASTETLVNRLCQRMATSDRKDDNLQTMKMRIATFIKHNEAVIKSYRDRVIKINAEQHPEAVFEEVQRAMEPIVQAAAAIEAKIAAAKALERAKQMAAYARSSTNIRAMSTLNVPRVSQTLIGASRTQIRPTSKLNIRASKLNIKFSKTNISKTNISKTNFKDQRSRTEFNEEARTAPKNVNRPRFADDTIDKEENKKE